MNAAFLFLSTFVLVLALGLQSQFVNNGHPAMAFANSLVIGASNLVLLKLAPDASGLEIAAYLLGGPLGIVTSMFLLARFTGWLIKRKCTNGGAK
jgi:hypothetical protein